MAVLDQFSRYKNSTVTDLASKAGGNTSFMVLNKFPSIPKSPNDKGMKVTGSSKFRPDLASLAAYGTPKFGWALLSANNIRSFAEFVPGLDIRVPPLDLIKNLIKDKDFKQTITKLVKKK